MKLDKFGVTIFAAALLLAGCEDPPPEKELVWREEEPKKETRDSQQGDSEPEWLKNLDKSESEEPSAPEKGQKDDKKDGEDSGGEGSSGSGEGSGGGGGDSNGGNDDFIDDSEEEDLLDDGDSGGGGSRDPGSWLNDGGSREVPPGDERLWENATRKIRDLLVGSKVRFAPLKSKYSVLKKIPGKPDHYQVAGRCTFVDEKGKTRCYSFRGTMIVGKYEASVVDLKFTRH